MLTAPRSPAASGVARRWRKRLSLGLGLPLVLGSTPAAAAGGAGFGVGGLTPWLGLVATLWAVLVSSQVAVSAGGLAMLAVVVSLLAGAVLAWRHQRVRSAPLLRSKRACAAVLARPGVAIPAGLDGEQVLEAARGRFLHLQRAWDAGDVPTLSSLTTPDMLEELMHVLTARDAGPSRTDVITLHAELLGLEELGTSYLASVEFSGLIRESAEQGAVPFRELWMLACAKEDAPSWRLARQQALL